MAQSGERLSVKAAVLWERPSCALAQSSPNLKGLTQLWKSRRIYPKYMPKRSVGSTDHVCKFLLKKMRYVEDIDVWNFRQERFMLRHLRQWSKSFGFGSALSHNSGAANTILFTIQTFNEHSRMAKLSQPYLRGHMRWNVTSLQVQLGLIGTYNFGRLSTLKSNILSTRKLRVLWPILWHISLTST